MRFFCAWSSETRVDYCSLVNEIKAVFPRPPTRAAPNLRAVRVRPSEVYNSHAIPFFCCFAKKTPPGTDADAPLPGGIENQLYPNAALTSVEKTEISPSLGVYFRRWRRCLRGSAELSSDESRKKSASEPIAQSSTARNISSDPNEEGEHVAPDKSLNGVEKSLDD